MILPVFIPCLVALVLLAGDGAEGKVYTRCEAAAELQRAGISRTWISNWVCLMESESGLDTTKTTGPKTASSYSYGILQINSGEYCTRGRRGGTCNLRCESLIGDNIQEDIACAKKIFDSKGFAYWSGWMRSCKNKPLPNLSNCRI